jgi:aspartate dehydrogenase
METTAKKRLAIAGCGKLGNIVMDAWSGGLLAEYEICGVMGRDPDHARTMAAKAGCPVFKTVEELLSAKPDYVAELASVQLVKEIGEKVLRAGSNLVVLSMGAFADEEFYERIQRAARESKTRVHIASGAIGGFDVLRTISLMGQVETEMVTRKGPESLKSTLVFREELLEDKEESQVFAGNTKEAIRLLPTKVNVSVAASLASAGTEKTRFSIISVPGMKGDDHKITAKTEGVTAVVDIYSQTSHIAGWSVVGLLRNLVSPIMF